MQANTDTHINKGEEEEEEDETYFTVLPDTGDLLCRDWTTVLGEFRVRELEIFP